MPPFTPTRAIIGSQAGNSNGFGNYGYGTIQEIIKVNRALTSNEIDQLHGYLAWKWGHQSDLPSGHAYKSVAPTVSL